MRHFLLRSLAALACLGAFSLPQNSWASKPAHSHKPNLSGVWALDHKASGSLEPLMQHIGANYLERKYATSANLKCTIHQTEHTLTMATRGPLFALDETLYLDGRTRPSDLNVLGATSLNVRTAWSKDHPDHLVETRAIKTRNGKHGHLIITRYLIDHGKSIVSAFTMKLDGEPKPIFVRQVWRKEG